MPKNYNKFKLATTKNYERKPKITEHQIYLAIHNKDLTDIIMLLNQGLNPNQLVNEYPLIVIAILKNDLTLVKLLIQFNADLNIKIPSIKIFSINDQKFIKVDNYTPLYAATWFGNYEIVKTLIANNAQIFPEDQDNLGYTLLHKAVIHKNIDIIKLLLQEKCNPNTYNKQQQTPLHTAIFHYRSSQDLSNKLTTKNNSDPVLDLSFINEDLFLIKLLLDFKADPSLIDQEQQTPLMLALKKEDQSLIDLFLEYTITPKNRSKLSHSINIEETFFLQKFSYNIHNHSTINPLLISSNQPLLSKNISENEPYGPIDLNDIMKKLEINKSKNLSVKFQNN